MKKKVLKKYPLAYSYKWRDCWCVYASPAGPLTGFHLGTGKTASQAWRKAAETLKRAQKG